MTRRKILGSGEREKRMEKKCAYCAENDCPLQENDEEAQDCIFNVVLYENDKKVLMYNLPEKRIYKIEKGRGLSEIDFKDAIREIDIIPEKNPSWKRLQILTLAKELGIFG